MSRQRIEITVDIDDELLADHVENHSGEKPPYTTDVSEWDGSDFFRAAEEGLLDPGETVLGWCVEVKDGD